VLHGEHLASSTEARLDLIGNEEDAEIAREFTKAGEEACGWNDVSTLL